MQFLEKTLVKDWLVLGPGFFSFSEKYSLSLQLWNCEAKDCLAEASKFAFCCCC